MPPFYPNPNQFPDQYQDGQPYYDGYNHYQYSGPPPPPQQQQQQQQQPSQVIPPYSRIQINIPPRSGYVSPQQSQPQYQFQYPVAQPYALPMNPQNFQYNQQQHIYPPQYQQSHVPPQPVYHLQMGSHMSLQPQPQPSAPQDTQQSRALQAVQPNVTRPQSSTKPQPEPEVEHQEPDYAILLLSLADEYLEAAAKTSIRSEEYFKLTATALGCIESVLNNFNLPPLREAQISLRYVQILLNETENHDKAETVLTKTVELCERMKYIDLKYAGQLLLAQVLYHSSSRAAMKYLQERIEDIEVYRHSAWEYAFRLQYMIFLVTSGSSQHLHSALGQLEKLSSTSQKNGDHAMYAFAAVLSALLHLRVSSTDSVSASQQSLAKVRAMQLNPDVSENPQLMIISEFVDLCCQIKNLDTAQSEQKRKAMQTNLYKLLESPLWRNDGVMYVALNPASLKGLAIQDGGIIVERQGKYFLAFSWLPKDEVEDLGYLLSGVSAASKNAGEGGKAERFLDEGLEMLYDIMKDKRQVNNNGDKTNIRRRLVECHFMIERAFLQCSKGQWDKAQNSVASVRTIAQSIDESFPSDMRLMVTYLEGAIHQGSGDLVEALKVFTLPTLRIQTQVSTPTPRTPIQKPTDVARDLSMLAAINVAFIIQQPSHPQHFRLQQLINVLDQQAHSCPNQTIQAAYNFVLASLPNNTIIKTKQHLSDTLHAAQHVHNAQITTLCLVSMQEKFFRGVVGEQAIKCARAASHQARRLNEPIWISVATGLEAECLDLHGMNEDAAKKRAESEKMSQMLPEKVQQARSQ